MRIGDYDVLVVTKFSRIEIKPQFPVTEVEMAERCGKAEAARRRNKTSKQLLDGLKQKVDTEFFDVVCTVHPNKLCKWTNKMHFLYLFILQFSCPLYMSRTIESFIIRS